MHPISKLSIIPFRHIYNHPSSLLSIQPSFIRSSNHSSTHLSIPRTIFLFFQAIIQPFIHPSLQPAIHSSSYPSIQPVIFKPCFIRSTIYLFSQPVSHFFTQPPKRCAIHYLSFKRGNHLAKYLSSHPSSTPLLTNQPCFDLGYKSSIHPAISPSIHQVMKPSIRLSNHSFLSYPFIFSSIKPSFIHQFFESSARPSVHQHSVTPSFRPFNHPFVQPTTQPII